MTYTQNNIIVSDRYIDPDKFNLYDNIKERVYRDVNDAYEEYVNGAAIRHHLIRFCEHNLNEDLQRIPNVYTLCRFLLALDDLNLKPAEIDRLVTEITEHVKNYRKVDINEEVDLEL